MLVNCIIFNDVDNWKDNDVSDYNKKIILSFWEVIVEIIL